ncbi:MAG: arylsulfotransferase family protein, partial [Myxococcota bacterium]
QHGFDQLLSSLGQPSEDIQILDERSFWRRARLLPNGDILAIHTHHSLIKLSLESMLIWAYPERVHHDLDVGPDGRIYTLINEKKVLPRIHPSNEVSEDFVVVLDAEGRELKRVSLLEAAERAGIVEILRGLPRRGDLFHANAVELLDGRLADAIPAFAAGNLLVSLLLVNTIAVLDLESEELVWWQQGNYRLQHDPSVLDDGRLLVFDNFGPALGETERNLGRGHYQHVWHTNIVSEELPVQPASAVLEVDPRTGQVMWSYRGTPERFFSSETCGAAERLPNGNTLIVETQFGRAFEITREKETVWEFVSPHVIGDNVARLFDLVRVPEASLEWLKRGRRAGD